MRIAISTEDKNGLESTAAHQGHQCSGKCHAEDVPFERGVLR